MEKTYKRQFREHRPETKEQISKAMKEYHKNKGTEAARSCASKQSQAMKRYWQGIPSKSEFDKQNHSGELTMQDYLNGRKCK